MDTSCQLKPPNPKFTAKKIKSTKYQTLEATTNYFKVKKPIGCYFRVSGTFCVVEKNLCEKLSCIENE